MRVGISTTLSSAMVLLGVAAHAGDELPRRLTLREATAHALERSPARATATARESSADARVSIAKADATPRVSVLGQLNRSTGNVVPGATFAMTGVPGVQGPPGATRFGSGTWQTAAALTASWDILELVRRPTIVEAAEKDAIAVRAESEVTSVDVVAQTADAYLIAVEARALQRAAEASAKRTDTFHEVVATLAGQKLRPELDRARADTELAAAHALVEKTRLGTAVSAAKLADAIGETGWSVEVVDDDFATLPPAPESKASVHPAITAHDDAAKAAEARASVAKLVVMPKVEVVGAAWLRGGGYVLGGGPNSGDADGLLPDTPNWAVGLVATWTPTDILTANAKATAENADATVQRSKAAAASAGLATEVKVARATLASYLVIAKETSSSASAARRAVELANTRYTTGIGNVVEVADAERALAAAERDEAIARLEAWRALVAVYRAQGDLRPLVGAIAKGKG